MPQKLSRSSLNVSKNDIDTAVSADRTVISNEGKHFITAFVLTPDSSSACYLLLMYVMSSCIYSVESPAQDLDEGPTRLGSSVRDRAIKVTQLWLFSVPRAIQSASFNSRVLDLDCGYEAGVVCGRCASLNRPCEQVHPELVPLSTALLEAHQAYVMSSNDEDEPDVIDAAYAKLRTAQQALKNKLVYGFLHYANSSSRHHPNRQGVFIPQSPASIIEGSVLTLTLADLSYNQISLPPRSLDISVLCTPYIRLAPA
ncbi:hypothetical protein A7D00_3819 [Trichophyton violaceum]|uniref:Uncharacterized protein n=1 Tax=Trichophyton violaceum TaxID=34388 RepID=A0A178FHJ5_TRIVO|nr:hypothetical protein A7D00_3819 [Trichophyton violaceum]